MAATYSMVDADWSVNASKVIDYIGNAHGGAAPSYGSGIQLHRWLADLSDDTAFIGDDIIDRTKPVASKRFTNFIIQLKNGYTITPTAIEHLYDCSITQGVIGTDQIIWDGITVYGNCPVIHVLQSGSKIVNAFWNNDPDALGFGLHSATGISHKFLVKVHDFVANGGDIDGRRLIGTTRAWNKTWKEFAINGSERGKNTLALDEKSDLNNTSTTAAIAALAGMSNQTEGYVGIDADGDTNNEFYYSSWTKGTNSTNQLYEHTKLQAYDGSAATLYGLAASDFRGITHEIDVDTPTGVFSAFEAISWTGGTGQMLAINSATVATKLWMQLLTGVTPVDGDVITGGTSGATVAMNIAIVSKGVEAPFIGTSIGTAIIAAFGFGVSSTLTTSDKLTDLSGAVISPPDVVSFIAGNLFKGSVTLYPWDGVAVDSDDNPVYNSTQMTLATALSGLAETQVVVNLIPDNTPDTGSIRITLDDTTSVLVAYTSRNTGANTYTIGATDFTGVIASINNGVWNAYLDVGLNSVTAITKQFSYTYGSDIKAVLEIRDPVNLVQQYIQPITLGNTAQTVNAIRNSDA